MNAWEDDNFGMGYKLIAQLTTPSASSSLGPRGYALCQDIKNHNHEGALMCCGGCHGKPELTVVDDLILMEIMSPLGIELNGGTIIKVSYRNRIINTLLTCWNFGQWHIDHK